MWQTHQFKLTFDALLALIVNFVGSQLTLFSSSSVRKSRQVKWAQRFRSQDLCQWLGGGGGSRSYIVPLFSFRRQRKGLESHARPYTHNISTRSLGSNSRVVSGAVCPGTCWWGDAWTNYFQSPAPAGQPNLKYSTSARPKAPWLCSLRWQRISAWCSSCKDFDVGWCLWELCKSSNGNVRMFTWGCEWIIYIAMDLQCVIPNEGGKFWLCRTRKVPVISDVRGPAQICKPARASHPKARPCWAVVEEQESPTSAQAHYAWSLEPQLLRLPVIWLPAFGLKLYNSTCLYYMTLNLFDVSDGFEWDQILLDANNYEDLDWRHYTDIWQSSLKINVEVGIII